MGPNRINPKAPSTIPDATTDSTQETQETQETPKPPVPSVDSTDSFETMMHNIPTPSSSKHSLDSTSLDSAFSSTTLDSETDEPPRSKKPLPPQAQTPQVNEQDIKALEALSETAAIKQQLEREYQIDDPVKQKGGTNQCWWLSFLENLRDMDKLDDAFTKGPLANTEPPEKSGKSVYGPRWQRTVMAHLKKQSGKDAWYKSKDTVPVSSRPEQLERLMNLLGISGVSIETPISLTPVTLDDAMNKLEVGQSVQVDKTDHAMSGIVNERKYKIGSKHKTRKVITVYNQAKDNEFDVWPQGDAGQRKLTSKSQKTVINYIIPLRITPPDAQ